MKSKKLKYQALLRQFPNCPPDDFEETNNTAAYRWVHQPIAVNDFLPANLLTNPPPRVLDDSDKMCHAYGLSMFNTLQNALHKYQKEFQKRRPHQQQHFKEDKGAHIAALILSPPDGIAGKPNNHNGHFTFHEYENAQLTEKINNIYPIFEPHDTLIS